MIGMQYKIMLPKDYDMNIIRKRVSDNGHKTDGFSDLMFKFYLITEKSNFNNHYNSYAPLYLWKNNEGMNQFIFDGYYDGILDSFGWQHINIGVPLFINVNEKIKNTKYVVEYVNAIPQNNSLKNIKKIFSFS